MSSPEDDLPRVKVAFVISGADLEPDEVTASLGREPSRAFRKGDAKVPGKTVWRHGWWSVTVGPERTLDAEPLVDRLVATLAGGEGRLKELVAARGYEAHMSVQVTQYGASVPAIVVSPVAVAWLAAVGAAFEVDTLAVLGD